MGEKMTITDIYCSSEVDYALVNFMKWKKKREKQMSLISQLPPYPPPFDCLLTFNSNKSIYKNLNTATFNQIFSSAIASNKFITCLYKGHKIGNFEQAGFIEGEKKGRVIHSEDDFWELHFVFGRRFTYLRNFIINGSVQNPR